MAEDNKKMEAVELKDEEVEEVTGGVFGGGNAGYAGVGGASSALGTSGVADARGMADQRGIAGGRGVFALIISKIAALFGNSSIRNNNNKFDGR